ncbi:hypothetical protein [Hymenobacter elongatus]|uniref:DUF4292 domain-containing protein n=1 Tax=Hymenobacter elongatus TaxID=877208 RepID=A0A4Z0PJR1_9BACT|nr:hypothetical protein [Hymenobacter elongatus]TGE14270.1 hypothetical protein E5J99_16790 [Hymenobacter elongatus]
MRSLLWVAVVALTSACDQQPGGGSSVQQPARKPLYFDVKGFLDTQTALLTKRQAAVEKQVTMRDGQVETTRVVQVDWSKELQIFYQADINKPALRGTYEAQAGLTDASGAPLQVYRRRAGVDNIVDRLQATGGSAPNGIIEAVLTQDNPLFFSRKTLLLNYRNGLLTTYQVRGVQKLVLFDTIRYSATVRVL